MKALLIAAAILAPALALANDPLRTDRPTKNETKKTVTDLTSTQVLGKLRMIHQTSIEMGQIAPSHAQSAAVKSLAAAVVTDHERLDAIVTDYALRNNIVLAGGTLEVVRLTPAQSTTYDRDRGPAMERPVNEFASREPPAEMPFTPNSRGELAKRETKMDQLRAQEPSHVE